MKELSKVEKKLLNYTEKAGNDYDMIRKGDRILVCLSGGKDSFTMLKMLRLVQRKMNDQIELLSFTLDQSQPGWDDTALRAWLKEEGVPFEILTRDTYSIVTDKIPEGKTYCSLCSRLRRGIIYRYARENGFNKVALGHHRDDLIRTLLMSIFYSGTVKSMPPKLLTDDKQLMVIRPLAYCQEADIIRYRDEQQFPIIPCNLCGSQANLKRVAMKKLIDQLASDNPKVPSNILHALQSVKPSQLMDRELWNFRALDNELGKADGDPTICVDDDLGLE
jgi:tRNA 2-thiocytidine biosynthesis protein TtcA